MVVVVVVVLVVVVEEVIKRSPAPGESPVYFHIGFPGYKTIVK